jgi:hypothetical protein
MFKVYPKSYLVAAPRKSIRLSPELQRMNGKGCYHPLVRFRCSQIGSGSRKLSPLPCRKGQACEGPGKHAMKRTSFLATIPSYPANAEAPVEMRPEDRRRGVGDCRDD